MNTKQISYVLEDWGLIGYLEAYQRQKDLVNRVIAGESPRLILCEHPAVLTMGRMTKPENLLWTTESIKAQGVDVISVDRGGDVTLHAPGQLVAYPIMNLSDRGRDLKVFLEELEQVVIDLLREFDILAGSINGQRGVWAGKDKIASIGIGVRKWVSYHGLGLNVNTDLKLFRMIRPCGLNVDMTSMEKLKGAPVDMALVKEKIVGQFVRHFGLSVFETVKDVKRKS
jgi:lipoate-protein ligase B